MANMAYAAINGVSGGNDPYPAGVGWSVVIVSDANEFIIQNAYNFGFNFGTTNEQIREGIVAAIRSIASDPSLPVEFVSG